MSREEVKRRSIRTRQWAPLTLLIVVWIFSAIGWERNDGMPSISWALYGLLAGAALISVVHVVRRRS